MINKLRELHIATIQEKEEMINKLSNEQLEDLYFEAVDLKERYNVAYERLLNELNKRKDEQIKNGYVS